MRRALSRVPRTLIGVGEASSSTAHYRSYSSRLPHATRDSEVTDELSELVDTLRSLKEQSRRPGATAYRDLIESASRFETHRLLPPYQGDEPSNVIPHESLGWDITKAALADAEAGGIELSEEVYDIVASFTGLYPGLLPFVMTHLPDSYRASGQFLSRLCRIAIHSNNIEQIMMILHEMWNRGARPSIIIIVHTIRLCCDAGLPRLAMDLADKFEREAANGTLIPSATWVRILISSAENSFLEGVETSWDRAVTSGHYTPDEGLLASILNVAARTGKPDLITRALDILPVLSLQPQEFHLVALMEAYVNAGQVPQALRVLSTVRNVGLVPTSATASPLLPVLNSAEVVDQAFFALEDMKARGETIDITAFNVVLEATSRLNDLQRVRATQLAASDLGVVPDIDTFNSVLSVCVSASHRELGDTVLKEMKDAGISPDGETYHNLILLCLTQHTYDDAFFYLEKSKSEGFKPLASAYQRLALKCKNQNDTRYRLVVDEMEALGYKLEPVEERDGTRKPRERQDRTVERKSYGLRTRREVPEVRL